MSNQSNSPKLKHEKRVKVAQWQKPKGIRRVNFNKALLP